MTEAEITSLEAVLESVVPAIFQMFISALPMLIILVSLVWVIGFITYLIRFLFGSMTTRGSEV